MLMNPSDETVQTRVVDKRPEDSGRAISSVCTAFTLYWRQNVGEEKIPLNTHRFVCPVISAMTVGVPDSFGIS
jgi:hypothetical protein